MPCKNLESGRVESKCGRQGRLQWPPSQKERHDFIKSPTDWNSRTRHIYFSAHRQATRQADNSSKPDDFAQAMWGRGKVPHQESGMELEQVWLLPEQGRSDLQQNHDDSVRQ